MNLAELFVRTYQDLQSRVTPPVEEYDMVRASGLLRQLLADKQSTAPRVAKEVGVPLRFTVNAVVAGPLGVPGLPDPASRYTNVDPFDLPSVVVGLDDFLARPTVVINAVSYSVRDVIRLVAHVDGGVHAFPPENDREARLWQANPGLLVGNARPLHRMLLGIAQVTVTALTPVVSAVTARGD